MLGLLTAVSLMIGFEQAVGQKWGEVRAQDHLPEVEFLRQCAQSVPEDAIVYLVTNDFVNQAANRLYPRRIFVCDWETALAEVRRRPDAFVVRFVVPFDPAQAMVVRGRDLP